MNEFVSYGNEWQLYKGKVDWDDLTIRQQDEIIVSYMQPEGSDVYPSDVVMKHNAKKVQVDRIGDLFYRVSFIFEANKIIPAFNAWTPGHKKIMCDFYKGTLFGSRLREIIEGWDEAGRTSIPGSDFDKLGKDVYHEMEVLNFSQLQAFVQTNLTQDGDYLNDEAHDKIIDDAIKAVEENPSAVAKENEVSMPQEKRARKRTFWDFMEHYVAGWMVLLFWLVVLFLVGNEFLPYGKRVLSDWGLIDYQYETKGDRRYKTFLNSVKGCQLKDAVSSPEKTDKWPRYAVYACPDGSRKTWRYKVKVITDFKGKLIVE